MHVHLGRGSWQGLFGSSYIGLIRFHFTRWFVGLQSLPGCCSFHNLCIVPVHNPAVGGCECISPLMCRRPMISLLMCSRPTMPPDDVKDPTSPTEWHG